MNQPDWQQALAAQAEVLAMHAGPYGDEIAYGWLKSRFDTYGRTATSPSAAAFAMVVQDLIAAEPIFITEEMQALVYEAMETFDRTEEMHLDDLFLRSGFALLEHPFVFEDIKGKRLAWRAVGWRYDEMPTGYTDDDDKLDESSIDVRGVLRIMLWSHIDDPDDYPLPDDLVEEHRRRGLLWGISHATLIPLEICHDLNVTSNEGDPKADWLVFFRVMQRLMAERIVVKHSRRVARPRWREAKRRGLDIRDVVVVELRRAKEPTAGESVHEGDWYSHRFLVRGHWRQQWYPSLQAHRQKYIGTFVKGPEDKDLVVKKRTWLWDR